jgi:hypothetical protein
MWTDETSLSVQNGSAMGESPAFLAEAEHSVNQVEIS